MYRALSMAKVNQITPAQREQQRTIRKFNIKRTMDQKVLNNINFFREVEEERYQLHNYGPVYFYFPEIKQLFEAVSGIEEFKRLFEAQKQGADVAIDLKIVTSHQKTKTRKVREDNYTIQNVKVFCRQCGPKLIMKYYCGARTAHKFSLVYFDNSHHHDKHGFNQHLTFQRRYKEIEVKERTCLSDMDWKNVFDEVFEKSKEDKMYYLRHPLYKYLPRFRRVYTNYKFEILEIKYLNWDYWYQPYFKDFDPQAALAPEVEAPEDNPDFFMIIHPEMRKNFLKYGDVCYLTVIDDGIIRKKEPYYDGIRFWEIVAFSGLTQENRFGPFCLAFLELAHHSPENIGKIASKFFNIMQKTPKVLITPNDPFFEEAAASMHEKDVFRGRHLFDPICELEKIAQRIQSPDEFKYFYSLVQSTTPSEYYYHL